MGIYADMLRRFMLRYLLWQIRTFEIVGTEFETRRALNSGTKLSSVLIRYSWIAVSSSHQVMQTIIQVD